MSDSKDFFLSVTKRIFSNWTALKMAVEHGMGTRGKANEFCHYITDVMYMNEGLSVSEIALELEDYMDQQFNTELQDFSGRQVAEELFKFHCYCIENNKTQIDIELGKLPPLQAWIEAYITRKNNNESVMVHSDNDSESDKAENDMETEDTEWTKVKTKRKR